MRAAAHFFFPTACAAQGKDKVAKVREAEQLVKQKTRADPDAYNLPRYRDDQAKDQPKIESGQIKEWQKAAMAKEKAMVQRQARALQMTPAHTKTLNDAFAKDETLGLERCALLASATGLSEQDVREFFIRQQERASQHKTLDAAYLKSAGTLIGDNAVTLSKATGLTQQDVRDFFTRKKQKEQEALLKKPRAKGLLNKRYGIGDGTRETFSACFRADFRADFR